MIKDYREIREVVMQYVNGCAAGDVELAKKAFHKDAVMYGYLNGRAVGRKHRKSLCRHRTARSRCRDESRSGHPGSGRHGCDGACRVGELARAVVHRFSFAGEDRRQVDDRSEDIPPVSRRDFVMCNGKERAGRCALFRLLLSERDCTASIHNPDRGSRSYPVRFNDH